MWPRYGVSSEIWWAGDSFPRAQGREYGWAVTGAHGRGSGAGSLRTSMLLLKAALEALGHPLPGSQRPGGGDPSGMSNQDSQSALPENGSTSESVTISTWVFSVTEGPARARVKMLEDGGCTTPRAHRHPAGLVQTSSQLGPQTLGTPRPHHHGHRLWK